MGTWRMNNAALNETAALYHDMVRKLQSHERYSGAAVSLGESNVTQLHLIPPLETSSI